MGEFVTIITDQKRDMGLVLTKYGRAHGKRSGDWVFLAAARDQTEERTRKITEAYGSTLR